MHNGFKVGDIVEIKSAREFQDEFGGGGVININTWDGIRFGFNEVMLDYCGAIGTVVRLGGHQGVISYRIVCKFNDETLQMKAHNWNFSLEMFKPYNGVYPEPSTKIRSLYSTLSEKILAFRLGEHCELGALV